MEVERLIVLVLSAETQRNEIQEADKRDGYALAVKFLNKRKAEIAKGWQEVANGAGFDVAGHGAAQIGKHAAMVVHCRDGKLLTELDVITAFLRDAKTCGIYILMHGIHGMAIPNEASATFLSPEYVAKLAGTMCPKKTISLLKVNIVGCTLAMKPEAGQGDKKLRKVRKAISKAGSWAQAFCRRLSAGKPWSRPIPTQFTWSATRIPNSRLSAWTGRNGPRAPSSDKRRSAYRPEPTRKSRWSPRIEPR
jgi:hypothetical protein